MAALIHPDARLSAAWLPLNRLVVGETEEKDIERVRFYLNLMDASGLHAEPPLTVRPIEYGYFMILNGHHKFMAHILAGKAVAPCVIIEE
jgi:hypothetical protein